MMSFVKRAVQAEIDAPRIENKIYKKSAVIGTEQVWHPAKELQITFC